MRQSWSVATEWQIYFFFPLISTSAGAGLAASQPSWARSCLASCRCIQFPGRELACPWLLALFAMGMEAAGNYPGLPCVRAWRSRISWGWVFLITLAASAAVTAVSMGVHRVASSNHPITGFDRLLTALMHGCGGLRLFDNWKFHFCYDLLSGLGVACFLSWAARRSVQAAFPPGHSPIDDPEPALFKVRGRPGVFSYSLYLTHARVEALLETAFSRLPLGPNGKAFSFVIAATLGSVALRTPSIG